MSQVISLRYPTSIHPLAAIGGLVLALGLVVVIGLGFAMNPEPASTPVVAAPVAAPIPLESEYLREISAEWGAAPVAAPIPLESEYLREISAGW